MRASWKRMIHTRLHEAESRKPRCLSAAEPVLCLSALSKTLGQQRTRNVHLDQEEPGVRKRVITVPVCEETEAISQPVAAVHSCRASEGAQGRVHRRPPVSTGVHQCPPASTRLLSQRSGCSSTFCCCPLGGEEVCSGFLCPLSLLRRYLLSLHAASVPLGSADPPPNVPLASPLKD